MSMPTWNRRWTALAVGAGLVVLGIALLPTDSKPELDEGLVRAVAPLVHADLPSNRKVTWPSTPGGRWFCAERAVETRRDGDTVRVGMLANCSEYSPREGALVQNGGRSGALVVTLVSTSDGYRVHDVQVPLDGAGHDASLRRMFSAAGYEEVRRSANRAGPDPAPEARAAFGLPADSPVVLRPS